MTMLGRLWDAVFPPKAVKQSRAKAGDDSGEVTRRSRFDAAQTGPDNRNHWANADDLSANAAADPATRRTLRRRTRYERDNDPHVSGLMEELADDVVGTCPRLQLSLGLEHESAARQVEKSFRTWCRVTGFGGKLRVLQEAKPTDGESFGLMVTNPQVAHPVKMDVRLFETDQVETPGVELLTAGNTISGIEFDQDGNPQWYHVLRQHPGDSGFWNWTGGYDRVSARFILHWFRPRRPGQARGLPKLTPALPVASQARRFSLATLAAAEYAASINGILETDAPPPDPDDDGDSPEPPAPWSEAEYRRNTLLVTPAGAKIKQLEAEHPTANYGEFMDRQHGTIGRAVRAPLNKVTGSSANFNFASGRLDHLPYQRMVWIERDDFEHRVIDRVFKAWCEEAALVGQIPDTLPPLDAWEWTWFYDAFEQLDPLKETQATELKLRLNLTTLSEACAERGMNWRDVLQQRALELAHMRELERQYGVTFGTETPTAPPPAPDPNEGGPTDAD